MSAGSFSDTTDMAVLIDTDLGTTLTNNNVFRLPVSEVVVAALIQNGPFAGRFASPSTSPPGDTSLIWPDKNFNPTVYKYWTGAAWAEADWYDIWDISASLSGTEVNATSIFGTNNLLVRTDGTVRNVQPTGISVDDDDNVSGIGTLTVGGTFKQTATGFQFGQIESTDNGVGWEVVGAAGFVRQFKFKTGANSRWALVCNAAAEGGSDAGSNLEFNRFDDSGGFLGSALAINRATGNAAFEGNLTFLGKQAPYILEQNFEAQAHTGDTDETTVKTVTIPAGTFGANGSVKVTTIWSNNSSGNTKTFRVKLDGNTFSILNGTTSESRMLRATIGNRNSESSQVVNQDSATGGWGAISADVQVFSVDTSTAVDLTWTVELADAGDNGTLEGYIVEVLYGA